MDVKCPGCYKITTVFSHAQGSVVCAGCSTILCQSTGGRAKLTEGIDDHFFTFCFEIKSLYFLQDAPSEGSHTKQHL